MVMACGVLALQGDWGAHQKALARLGIGAMPVRSAAELARVGALVLPGGESTTMNVFFAKEGLGAAIRERVAAGMPVLATCAGLILLARRVRPHQPSLGLLDIDVERNAYGRQIASTIELLAVSPKLGSPESLEGVFIRAPRVVRVGAGVSVLARRGDDPVLVEAPGIIAATFHPELTKDLRVHARFVTMMEERHD
jgi:5'-phosphate synthase pdxT subunit